MRGRYPSILTERLSTTQITATERFFASLSALSGVAVFGL